MGNFYRTRKQRATRAEEELAIHQIRPYGVLPRKYTSVQKWLADSPLLLDDFKDSMPIEQNRYQSQKST